MTLQQAEAKLSEINVELDKLLQEREIAIKEWNIANKRDFEISDYRKNLVYTKAIEIRESLESKS